MADLGRDARPPATAFSGVAVVLGACLFPDRSGGPGFIVATVGFNPASAFLWDSTARRRYEFRHETGGFQGIHVNLWDSIRQKHSGNGRGRELFVKRVLEVTTRNPLFSRGKGAFCQPNGISVKKFSFSKFRVQLLSCNAPNKAAIFSGGISGKIAS